MTDRRVFRIQNTQEINHKVSCIKFGGYYMLADVTNPLLDFHAGGSV